MQLVINSRGSYLKKQQNCFLVKNEDKVFEVSANKVESILITTSATITTDAIKFAVENNIDIVFLDHFGDPYGRVWHSKLGSTVLIRRKQLEIANKEQGFKLARGWIEIKINNQIEFLKDLKKNRPEKREEMDEYITNINTMIHKLLELDGVLDEARGTIMGIEGMSSRHYFNALSYIMPEKWKFEGRSRNPAVDEFNCLLNYGYGVLYSMVEKACILSGLDPYVGFMHTDNYNKKSLVFDLIEMYRIHVDRTVVNLFSKRKVKEEYFDKIPNGLSLNKEGKALLIQSLNEALDQSIGYHGRNIKIRNTIQYDCHKIANELIK
ncbi:CRISPR-associated protein, Cas1 family [Methanolobus tindarius DSM 2278]|uniref:CRISPR-associated endonuclease Cas1 n=1 Tax=Methanolobus tindarius DSM 2278 TaxID=1090322 RepID=W9DV91_METTI|nr:CRISPR-associated endonuclease Cas1 [Methanolobus tindarius]ETA67351.1 CRISPR-associated protein, Cas1 family [Methanolobus tindarius DSM 2278]